MSTNMHRWHLLPGMGANSSMYDLLKKHLNFEINFIDWPKFNGEETFMDAAARIIEENGIMDGDIVGGSSLGGMVAIEIARQRNLKAVVLIGSAMNSAEVQIILSMLAPLSVITPISFIQKLSGKHENIVTEMFAEADPEFIRAMCQYLPKWTGISDLRVPLYRIHGKKDRVIICPTSEAAIVLDAGHLIAITHAKECGEYLNTLNGQLTICSTKSA